MATEIKMFKKNDDGLPNLAEYKVFNLQDLKKEID